MNYTLLKIITLVLPIILCVFILLLYYVYLYYLYCDYTIILYITEVLDMIEARIRVCIFEAKD